jgi:hypothetical protein
MQVSRGAGGHMLYFLFFMFNVSAMFQFRILEFRVLYICAPSGNRTFDPTD